MSLGYLIDSERGRPQFLTSVLLPTMGHWPGRAKLRRKAIAKLAKILPKDPNITLRVEGGGLKLGSIALSCIWEPN